MTSPHPYSLSQTVVLITGGGTGIGKACAQSAADGGAAHVILCGRRLEPLDEAAKDLRQHHAETSFSCVAADITNALSAHLAEPKEGLV